MHGCASLARRVASAGLVPEETLASLDVDAREVHPSSGLAEARYRLAPEAP